MADDVAGVDGAERHKRDGMGKRRAHAGHFTWLGARRVRSFHE